MTQQKMSKKVVMKFLTTISCREYKKKLKSDRKLKKLMITAINTM